MRVVSLKPPMIHRRCAAAALRYAAGLVTVLVMFASTPMNAEAQTCASGTGQLTGSLNGVNSDTHAITLLPCQTLSLALAGTTGGSGMWAQVDVRVEIRTASHHVLYSINLLCGLTCSAALPHSTAANGSPLPGTRGVEGLAAEIYIKASSFNWGAVPPFDYVMTLTKTGRDGYNIGGIELCDAPEIDIEEEQYGSVYPLEPGQYYRIHLLQDQLIYATGTATASGWGSNFRIYVLNGSGTYLATIANAPAYGVTAFPSPGNNPLTFVNTGAAADFYLQITSASSMTTDFKFQVRTPRLTVSPNPVVRGQTATFTVQGALGATISDWKYLPTVFAQVERTQNTASTTWPGIIVTGGYAQVTVTMAGRTILLNSPQLTVNARSGWARTAVSHTEKDAGDQTPSGHTFTFVDPPTGPGTAIGEYEIDINYKFGHSQITDNGPNHGFRYVTSISDVNDTVSPARPTGFYWAYLASLKNQTEFYQKQCGTYDALNNPNGGISKENLVFGIKRHEALGTNSHYQQYVTAQNDPSNNLGIAAEAIVDAPTSTSQQFIDKVNGILGAKRELINAATAIQPPGAQYTDGNQYMGGINYFPYSPC